MQLRTMGTGSDFTDFQTRVAKPLFKTSDGLFEGFPLIIAEIGNQRATIEDMALVNLAKLALTGLAHVDYPWVVWA
jgi:hypothetical protein